jgi:hypothetical protein
VEHRPAPHEVAGADPVAPEPQHVAHHDGTATPFTDHAPAACTTDHARSAAEIWAELSTPDHVEKAVEDEARRRHLFKDLHLSSHNHPAHPGTGVDSRDP